MKKFLIFIVSSLIIIQSCVDSYQNKTKTTSGKKFFSSDSEYQFQTEPQTDFVEIHLDTINAKKLYETKCARCHPKMRNDYPLRNNPIVQDTEYLQKYLNKQDSLLLVKDLLTVKIKKEWGDNKFTHRFNLSPIEIEAIQDHIAK